MEKEIQMLKERNAGLENTSTNIKKAEKIKAAKYSKELNNKIKNNMKRVSLLENQLDSRNKEYARLEVRHEEILKILKVQEEVSRGNIQKLQDRHWRPCY